MSCADFIATCQTYTKANCAALGSSWRCNPVLLSDQPAGFTNACGVCFCGGDLAYAPWICGNPLPVPIAQPATTGPAAALTTAINNILTTVPAQIVPTATLPRTTRIVSVVLNTDPAGITDDVVTGVGSAITPSAVAQASAPGGTNTVAIAIGCVVGVIAAIAIVLVYRFRSVVFGKGNRRMSTWGKRDSELHPSQRNTNAYPPLPKEAEAFPPPKPVAFADGAGYEKQQGYVDNYEQQQQFYAPAQYGQQVAYDVVTAYTDPSGQPVDAYQQPYVTTAQPVQSNAYYAQDPNYVQDPNYAHDPNYQYQQPYDPNYGYVQNPETYEQNGQQQYDQNYYSMYGAPVGHPPPQQH